jgi:carboxylesterase type B
MDRPCTNKAALVRAQRFRRRARGRRHHGADRLPHKAIPHWPAYTAADRATMMIDTEWQVQNDP